MPDYRKQPITTVRCAFNDWVDSLHRDGRVSQFQADTWCYPFQSYTQRELAKVPRSERKRKRLELDFAKMLVGPTCGAEAKRYAEIAVGVDADSLAHAMRAAADRYLGKDK
jgi:hypothetical protein